MTSKNPRNKRLTAILKKHIERTQQRVRRYVKQGESLVDDLLRERREAAKRE